MAGPNVDGWFPQEAQRQIEQLVSKAGVPGCTLLGLSLDHGTNAMAVGLADALTSKATCLESVFHLFSGTKVVTASALMLLVERGVVSLDSDVREFIPELDLRHRVTLRQIASHNSGLPDTLRAFLAVHYPEEPRPTTNDALAKYDLTKGSRPGRGAKYRNANYAVLAEVISRMAGMPFEQFVHAELLAPWGSGASFEVASFPKEVLATGHARRFDPMRLLALWFLGGHGRTIFQRSGNGYVSLREFDLDNAGIGGLLGAVADFAPVLEEFLSAENGVLRATSKHEMLTVHARGQIGVISAEGVGLAWKRGEVEGTGYWNHEGGGAGFCTELRLYPEEGVGFVIMMNLSQSKKLSTLAHDVCEMLRRAHTRLE